MQMSFPEEGNVLKHPLRKSLSRLYLGEVEVREFERTEARRVIFRWANNALSTELSVGPGASCTRYSRDLPGDWESWRREARSRKVEAFYSLKILFWPQTQRSKFNPSPHRVKPRNREKLVQVTMTLSRSLRDAHESPWAQKLRLGKEGLFLMCVTSLDA